MKISQDGFVSQFDFQPNAAPHRWQPGFYEGKLIDLPDEDLFLFSVHRGRFDLRQCAWYAGGFFNREEGCFRWPKPWKYDGHGIIQEEGDQLLIAFMNNNATNPVIFPSIIPASVNAFFGAYYQTVSASNERFPIKSAYYQDRFLFREKNADREFSVKEENGEVTLNLQGQNQTINIRINNQLVFSIKDGEVNIGGDATEPTILGNAFMTIFNSMVTDLISHVHPDPTKVSPTLASLMFMAATELSSVGKVK